MKRVSVSCRFLLIAGVLLISGGCTLFSEVTRAVAEACDRPSIRTTTNADLRTNCTGDDCSLWGAIALANTCNNGMVVELAESGRYEIGARPASSPAPRNVVFPAVTGRFTIAGNGATIARTVRDPFERFFLIQPRGDLTLTDLSLQGGGSRESPDSGSWSGGAIVNRGMLTMESVRAIANSATGSGGAVFNEGRLIVRGGLHAGNQAGGGCEGAGGGFLHNRSSGSVTLSNAVLQENRASCGGAVVNQGLLAVMDSVFRGNRAGTGDNNIYAMGGALQNDDEDGNEPLAMIVGSTFVGNQAMVGGAVGNTRGARALVHNSTISTNHTYTPCPDCIEDRPRHRAGGIANFGNLTLRDVTLFANTCTGSTPCPGGLINVGRDAIVTVQNSIIADNVGGDCAHDTSGTARFTVVGANLDADSSCPWFTVHASAVLGPLTDNGGPTATHAVLPDSPAHDAGTTCFTTDQRGFPRERSDTNPCDIGSFER